MSSINKVRIGENVYDIQDKTSGYAKTEYVDNKFAEAIAMGFKTKIVDVLPTENILHQVIYLVLNGDTEENNIYDEYVYNSNDEWEKIGSTKTNLSDYYDKAEVDEIIDNIDVGGGVVLTGSNKADEEILIAVNVEYQKYLNKEPYNIFIWTNDTMQRAYFEPSVNSSFKTIATPILRYSSQYKKQSFNAYIENGVITSLAGVSNSTFDIADKSYVTTQINNAIGNVNSVLATLTTIEEG